MFEIEKGKTPSATETIIDHQKQELKRKLATWSNKELMEFFWYHMYQFHKVMQIQEPRWAMGEQDILQATREAVLERMVEPGEEVVPMKL